VDRAGLARFFVVGFDGAFLEDAPFARLLEVMPPAGVVLFDRNVDGSRRNIHSPGQLRALVARLRRISRRPLLVAVDQEGGMVARLKQEDGFVGCPSAATLGRAGVGAVRRAAERVADQLRRVGVDWNLAPVVDLDLEPENPVIHRFGRSFGTDADLVCRCAQAWIRAHHRHGVACCLKHFPGHGSSLADSHAGFVDIGRTWRPIEAEVYRRLARSGLADAVMPGHLVHRGLDPAGLPATLSRRMLAGLLRDRLGFAGVIVSDDLQMGAIRDRWSLEEAVAAAFTAGCDLLLIGNNLRREPDALERGVTALARLVEQGLVPAASLRRRVRRIERLLAACRRLSTQRKE